MVSYTSVLAGWREEDLLMFSELETVREKQKQQFFASCVLCVLNPPLCSW